MISQSSAPSADALAVQTAAEPRQSQARPAIVRDALNRTRTSTAGTLALVAAATGTVLSVGGAIWAVQMGVPYPLAIMAGFCTLAGGVCLAAATVFLMTPDHIPAPIIVKSTPNYTAWKLMKAFSVSNASRLWCDIEPGSALTQDSIAWAKVLLGAISRGELPMAEKAGVPKEVIERERNSPNWHTEVTRDALQAWAKTHGFNPRFLQD
jgi:hypothetical protein